VNDVQFLVNVIRDIAECHSREYGNRPDPNWTDGSVWWALEGDPEAWQRFQRIVSDLKAAQD
jgi:hypothetical protein